MTTLLCRALLITLLPIMLWAQTRDSTGVERLDVILLNNGGLVRGKIVERIEGKKITIELRNGNRVEIPVKKIAEITTSESDYESHHRRILDSLDRGRPKPVSIREEFVLMQMTLGGGENTSVMGISGLIGSQSSNNLCVGIGAGYEKHEHGRFLPLLTELGYMLQGQGWNAYFYSRAGYSIGWAEHYTGADFGGFRIGGGAGCQWTVDTSLALTLRFGYDHQTVRKATSDMSTGVNWISVAAGVKL